MQHTGTTSISDLTVSNDSDPTSEPAVKVYLEWRDPHGMLVTAVEETCRTRFDRAPTNTIIDVLRDLKVDLARAGQVRFKPLGDAAPKRDLEGEVLDR